MAHKEQFEFVKSLKFKFPHYFRNCNVLEVGSLNINGSIRQFFNDCNYIGVDLERGPDVDIVCKGEDLKFEKNSFLTVSSCECFEHNAKWKETFFNMCRMAKPGGLIFFTCATTGRPEHGTTNAKPEDSPFTNEYYRNLTVDDFLNLGLNDLFQEYDFIVNRESKDLYFWGIKKTEDFNTFIITSTINSHSSFYKSEEKIEQTRKTIKSIRDKVSNCKIVMIDNSIPELSKKIFSNEVDLFLTYKNNLFTTFINYNKFNSGLGELLLMQTAIEQIKQNNLIGKRIFKISGRYFLSENFDLNKFDNYFGKYTFRIRPWAFTSDNYKTNTYVYYFEQRLWSFCSSLLDEYEKLMYKIFENMLQKEQSLEISKYHLLPLDSVVEINPIGVEGNMSGGEFIKD